MSAPVLTSLAYSSAPTGHGQSAFGSGFGATQGTSKLLNNNLSVNAAYIVSRSDTEIQYYVHYQGPVVVQVGGVNSNALPFTDTGNGGDIVVWGT